MAFLLLMGYLIVYPLLSGREVNLSVIEDISGSTRTFFSWLGTTFTNVVETTGNIISGDWIKDNLTKEPPKNKS